MDKNFKLCIIFNFINVILCDHWSQRSELIAKEDALMLGSSIKIQGIEKCINKTLMHLKLTELDRGLDNPNEFYPSTNFLKTVKYIEASEVYSFIKDIPKGAALHLHDMAMASPEYLYELTFTENLYVCRTKNSRLLLNFFLFHVDNRCEWIPLELAREEEGFEELLQSQLSMDTPVYKKYSNNKVAWTELLGTYATIEGLISYKPIFTSYLTDVLKKMYEDNVMFVELRTTLLPVYDLDGNDYGPSDVVALLKETLADFRCAHNDFLGGKIIYSPSRMVDQSWMDRYVQIVDELSAEHSDFVAGFDLTGQEDLSYPLSRFISSFKEMKSKVHFFFSAGETNWIGAKADLNLFDAVLLNPTRIGHAFTLFGHPELLKIVKENDIAIELCPISNQMMMLVSDLRNHPGKYLISHGYPIVVSSDNPGFWGARTLSHDWYMVFMAMADRKADLRLLMQLAINSIKYSTITNKDEALKLWRKKWNAYMNKMEQWCIDNDPDEKESQTEPPRAELNPLKASSSSWMTDDTVNPLVMTLRNKYVPETTVSTTQITESSPVDIGFNSMFNSDYIGFTNPHSTSSILSNSEPEMIHYPGTESTEETTELSTEETSISEMPSTTIVGQSTLSSLDAGTETDRTESISTMLETNETISTEKTDETTENNDTRTILFTTSETELPEIESDLPCHGPDLTQEPMGWTKESYNNTDDCLNDTALTTFTDMSTTMDDIENENSTIFTRDTTLPDCEDEDYELETTEDTAQTDDCVEYIDDGKSVNNSTIAPLKEKSVASQKSRKKKTSAGVDKNSKSTTATDSVTNENNTESDSDRKGSNAEKSASGAMGEKGTNSGVTDSVIGAPTTTLWSATNGVNTRNAGEGASGGTPNAGHSSPIASAGASNAAEGATSTPQT